MLYKILNQKGVQKLKRKEKETIKGSGWWPRTEEECLACGGEWGAPLCLLPSNSVCL